MCAQYVCVFEPDYCCRICLHGYCLYLSGYPLCPVVLRLQCQQWDMHRPGRAPAQSRGGREGRSQDPEPLQEVPAEEAEERQVGGATVRTGHVD